jgi:hypothetical protein
MAGPYVFCAGIIGKYYYSPMLFAVDDADSLGFFLTGHRRHDRDLTGFQDRGPAGRCVAPSACLFALAACIALHVSGRLVSTGSNINRFIGR